MARLALVKLCAILSLFGLATSSPISAQVEKIDPNDVIAQGQEKLPNRSDLPSRDDLPVAEEELNIPDDAIPSADDVREQSIPNTKDAQSVPPVDPIGNAQRSTTYQQDDVIAAATGVFGKGASGLGSLVEDIFKKQGEPNGYIIGREGGAALIFGLRYGSGTLYHKIEGERPVYWNGPSVGFDAGANAASTFVLVYNLYDTEDLYRRYPAGEGAAYLVGGFNASYLRRGDIVLIPIRLGVGARLGINAGYMKFRKKRKILPF